MFGAWLAFAVAIFLVSQSAQLQTNDNLSLPGKGSTKATDILAADFPAQENGTNPYVLEAREGKLTDSTNSAAVAEVTRRLQDTPHVERAVSPLTAAGAAQLSRGGEIGYVSLTVDVGPTELTEDEAEAILDAGAPAEEAGMDVAVGGYVGQELSQPKTEFSEGVGIGAAILILLVVFGTAAAMAVPIVSAAMGLVIGLSLITLATHVVEIPTVAPTLATMIGLGVGIDYALFIVSRHRSQLHAGMEVEESIARAVATAGNAVVFAGGTVVIALCSLAVTDIPIVREMGFAAAAVVVVAVLAANTLLPAFLAVLGSRIDSLRVPFVHRRIARGQETAGWLRWARAVAAHPWRASIVPVAILVVLAIPLLQLQLGQANDGQLPTSTQSRQAYDLLAEGFGPGVDAPFLIAADVSGTPAADREALLGRLAQALSGTTDVQAVSPPQLSSDGDAGLMTLVPVSSPSSQTTEDLVLDLRDTVIPRALAGTGAQAYVGGQTAGYIDLADIVADKLPLTIAVVIGLSFLVLLVAFRSVTIPAKAAVMNLLSIGAAYGVLTAVFQLGWGTGLLGLDGDVEIVSFIPLMMFAILFGLSMDYEVFIMSRIDERYRAQGDPREAVVSGLGAAGRVIISAALIMVAVFSSFLLTGDPTTMQFGLGMAVAVAIDATLVRCTLVPAVMVIGRRVMWWIPGWLDRLLPRFEIEGGDRSR